MIEPAAVIQEARRWIGTPFQHQRAHIGRGCDCVGLVRGVAENLGLVEFTDEQRRALESYSRTPNPSHMGAGLAQFLEPATETMGDALIVWIEWRKDLPMHLAITATFDGRPTLIQALSSRNATVEHGFTAPWRRRVRSYWRFPNVAYPHG